MEMEMEAQRWDQLESLSFMESGIYRLHHHSRVLFLDPVRLLSSSSSYSRFRLSPSAYYSRPFFTSSLPNEKNRKRKRRREPKEVSLNDRERSAETRHQQVRPLLLHAHSKLLQAAHLLNLLPHVVSTEGGQRLERAPRHDFVDLGSSWRAPFCEISLPQAPPRSDRPETRRFVPLFDNVIRVDSDGDVEAEFRDVTYILPPRSTFLMSELRQVRKLVPENSVEGFNLIVIDPPWENGSARQKSMYPTLPNRHFMYLPVKELAHADGALVALWITNRPKLQDFVEKVLLPAWGMSHVTPFYWLKVKPDGSLIGDLDLFHHRPYECLLLGYVNVDFNSACMGTFNRLKESRVIISIPGAYSRKPPLGELLSEFIPGQRPSRCIELFARELVAGWTSWGNEPLHFQDSMYFLQK